jgi:hypothetical protein
MPIELNIFQSLNHTTWYAIFSCNYPGWMPSPMTFCLTSFTCGATFIFTRWFFRLFSHFLQHKLRIEIAIITGGMWLSFTLSAIA